MDFRDILVHVDNSPRCEARLALAISLAHNFAAHLTGLHVIDIPPVDFFYGAAMPFAGAGPELAMDRMRAEAVAASDVLQARFRDMLQREGLQGGWRRAEGSVGGTLALHARYADLAILGQLDPYQPQPGIRDSGIVACVMTSGRPVLAVPFAGTFTMPERPLVAWNASREAARAVNDALPLLERAKMVTVLAVNPRYGIGGHGDVPATDIALHLARHGVRAEAAHTIAEDIGDAEALLSYASDISADLIVAGAYGHSRAREMVFGGVTRTLLAEMTVPVLLSH
jgi:nucleotide-binding universal stress UspA family protein